MVGGCPGLRLFTVAKATAGSPKADVSGAWQVCDAKTAKDFSAVAFYFGQELHRALGVPVGLIHASWGGTPAEAWTPREALLADASLKPLIDALDRTANDEGARAEAARKVADWEAKSFYQDTGNLGEAWRTAWRDPALPFVFVQLPNYQEPGPSRPLGTSAWAKLREAQAMTLRLPKTAMAVTLDIGERGGIHPRNKADVGRRLALQALKLVYRKEVIASGPVLRKMAREGSTIRVSFANVTSALVTADGAAPKGFMLAGADRAWHWADARIDGDSVVVSSPDVPEPVAVRYGWADDPPNTLRNQADLPAAPFRTDDWPARLPDSGL